MNTILIFVPVHLILHKISWVIFLKGEFDYYPSYVIYFSNILLSEWKFLNNLAWFHPFPSSFSQPPLYYVLTSVTLNFSYLWGYSSVYPLWDAFISFSLHTRFLMWSILHMNSCNSYFLWNTCSYPLCCMHDLYHPP